MPRVLITGVAGFVGSNLAKELLRRDYHVLGVDNLSQGFKRNIESLFKSKSFNFYKEDICNPRFILKISNKLDGIFHLAAYKIPRYGNALATLRINIKGTENILELARKNKCKVVFSSTSDVYGKNPMLPFSESSDLVLGETNVARWSYAASKIYDEHLCFAYSDEFKIPVVILRYFGGYGPQQNLTWWGGPQSVFISASLNKVALPIHGNGKQTRSFTYVSDMVRGTILAMESRNAVGEIFNIGNKREISIIELAKMIWKMINPNKKPLFEFIPYKTFSRKYEDVSRRVPGIEKAHNLLNFIPQVELEEGLPLTIDWQRKLLK